MPSEHPSLCRLLVTASVVPSSPILVTLMMEVKRSSKASVLGRATLRNIPEASILHSHRRENLKSYLSIYLTGDVEFPFYGLTSVLNELPWFSQ
jgi:hypothetical protein